MAFLDAMLGWNATPVGVRYLDMPHTAKSPELLAPLVDYYYVDAFFLKTMFTIGNLSELYGPTGVA